MQGEKLRIAILYEGGNENPYLALLIRGLRQAGYDVSCKAACSPQWLWKNRQGLDVLHFQWVQYFYNSNNAFSSTLWAIFFFFKLIIARILGYRIVWTVHNIMPHERSPGFGDVIARYGLVILANDIVFHCRTAARLLKEAFGTRGKLHVIPHGHYIGWYPDPPSKSEARAHFNIPDSEYVYLYFGVIRPYKGLEKLIHTFKKLSFGRLIIAGKPHNLQIESLIRQLSEKDPRISLHLSFIPDTLVTSFFECADSVVLPFSDVLTSGSAILALSLGRPVIAPALGCLPELISDRFGLNFDADSPEGLRDAMIDIRLRQYSSEEIKRSMMKNYDWLEIAELYRGPYGSA